MPLLNIFCGKTLIGRVDSDKLPTQLHCQPVGIRKPDKTGTLNIAQISEEALAISPCQTGCRLGRKEFRFRILE